MTLKCFFVQSLSHVWLWNPMDCITPGSPVLRHLLEFAQTHVHWVGDYWTTFLIHSWQEMNTIALFHGYHANISIIFLSIHTHMRCKLYTIKNQNQWLEKQVMEGLEVAGFEDTGRIHELRNAGHLWTRKDKESNSSLEALEGMQSCQHLDFSPRRPALDVWSPDLRH